MSTLNGLYNVSTAPHIRSERTTASIMKDVAIALVPASLFGIYNFGINALFVILVCIAISLLTEYLYEKFMKKTVTIGDFSAVVTGLLIALNMPGNIPLWIPALGSVFAILVVKMLFGGIGQNFMNPALAARAFLLISFTARVSNFAVSPIKGDVSFMTYVTKGALAVDGISGPTPLGALKAGESVDLLQMFLGNIGGTIGETSVLALLLGAAYLFFRKVITWRIPVTYIASFALFVLIFGENSFDFPFMAAHIFGGGLMLGAFFMATDYATSPITFLGQIVFGVALGILTGIFRLYGGAPEGVSYAIIICNMLVPLIEKITLPMAFGKGGKVNEQRQ